jgi:serine protease Do
MTRDSGLLRALCAALALVLLTARPAAAALPEFTTLVKQVSPVVVNISTTQKTRGPRGVPMPPFDPDDPMSEFFRRFFEGQPMPREREARSLGSGFLIAADGKILTNAHVVKGADQIVVRLPDYREVPAKLLGLDERTDVALLKIEGSAYPRASIGDSDKLEVGEWVLAIGSPFGLEHTATQGIVSAVGRTLPSDTYVPFIQTDVAVNPGNSGGPLFNTRGEVIGINAQIYSRTGGYMGLSFAIPINIAMRVAEQIEKHGRATHGWLGVRIQAVTPDLAESFGLDRARGALVASVESGSPADKAGIVPGDVILSWGGERIEQVGDLPPRVGATAPGEDRSVELLRNGKPRRVTVRVQALKDEAVERPQEAAGVDRSGSLGLELRDLAPAQRKGAGVDQGGALVVRVLPGPAERAGVREGDVLLRLNQEVVKDAAHAAELAGKLPPGKPVPVQVQRDGAPLFLALTVPEKQAE